MSVVIDCVSIRCDEIISGIGSGSQIRLEVRMRVAYSGVDDSHPHFRALREPVLIVDRSDGVHSPEARYDLSVQIGPGRDESLYDGRLKGIHSVQDGQRNLSRTELCLQESCEASIRGEGELIRILSARV